MVTEMKRRSKAQWQALIAQQQCSDMTAATFCRQHGVNAKYFSLRKKQFGGARCDFVRIAAQTKVPVESNVHSDRIKLRVIEVELLEPVSGQSEALAQWLGRLFP